MSASLVAPSNPFHTHAPLYSKVRPAYPPHLVDTLVSSARTREDLLAVDVGAGTGKLTLMLAERGIRTYAVEPSEAMSAQMPRHRLVSVVTATAEDTTLASACADLVVFAQSWHWVDPVRAGAEAARITTDGGVLALVWNQMDVSIPWVHRLSRIMRSGDVHRHDRPPVVPEPWQEPTLQRADWVDVVTPEALLELGTTRSSYLRQNDAGRQRMRSNLEWYLYEHLGFTQEQPLLLPYMTLAWVSHKKH